VTRLDQGRQVRGPGLWAANAEVLDNVFDDIAIDDAQRRARMRRRDFCICRNDSVIVTFFAKWGNSYRLSLTACSKSADDRRIRVFGLWKVNAILPSVVTRKMDGSGSASCLSIEESSRSQCSRDR
jgi:hypothetical protein